MDRTRGTVDLIHDGIDAVTALAEQSHRSIARLTRPRAAEGALSGLLRVAGEVAGPRHAPVLADAVAAAHVPLALAGGLGRMIAGTVYGSIRAGNAGARLLTRTTTAAVAAAAPSAPRGPTPPPLRADAMLEPALWADAAVGAVTGILGDHLEARGNGLDEGMRLRHGDRYLDVRCRSAACRAQTCRDPGDRDAPSALPLALADPTGRVAVFVHGLSTTEWSWSFGADRHHGDPEATFGHLLRRDLGFTPLYVRYNSGLKVRRNGRTLAALLEDLRHRYPVPIERLVLVGHSMGGLVARAATHHADAEGHGWLEALEHVVCLGAPHHGSWMEKLAHGAAQLLEGTEVPGLDAVASVLAIRSEGVRDMRWGGLHDADRHGHPERARRGGAAGPATGGAGAEVVEPVPGLDDAFLPGVAYTLVGATLTRTHDHPVGHLVGDVLVRLDSSTGRHLRDPAHPGAGVAGAAIPVRRITLGGLGHLALVNHPAVYEHLRRALEPS